MSEHTKGTWTIIQGTDARFIGLRDIFVEKTHIATVQAWGKEGQDNARLIAKAPAMHKQLASARAIMEKFVFKVDTGRARSTETYAEMQAWLKED